MSILSIKPAFSNLKQLVTGSNKERVFIKDLYTPTGIELQKAKSMLEHYAKAKKINIQFAHGLNELEEDVLEIAVTNKKGKTEKQVIDGNITDVLAITQHKKMMLENSDGCNYIANCNSTFEDTFIRRVYRTVERLANSLSNKKQK